MSEFKDDVKEGVDSSMVILGELKVMEEQLAEVKNSADGLNEENAILCKELILNTERQELMQKRLVNVMQFLKKFFNNVEDMKAIGESVGKPDAEVKSFDDMLNLVCNSLALSRSLSLSVLAHMLHVSIFFVTFPA